MRKLLVIMMLCFLSICSFQTGGYAEPVKVTKVLDSFPLEQKIAYSIVDGEWKPASVIDIVRKWGASLEIGYIGENGIMAGVSYDLGNLEKFAEVPILKYVDLDIGFYYSRNRINRLQAGEEDYGFSIKIMEVEF